MSDLLSKCSKLIKEGGASALVLKEYLQPVAFGPDAVIFPPTFAPDKKKAKASSDEDEEDDDNDTNEKGKSGSSSYIIDGQGENAVCLLDTVGSQANRLEPIFKRDKYKSLVPQITITVEGRSSPANLLDLGHRAADAFIKSTELAVALTKAFTDFSSGNALALARIATDLPSRISTS